MFRQTLIASAAIVCLAACQSAPATPPGLEAGGAQPLTPPPVEVDLFAFAIETGRWNAMIDRAREGVRQAPYPDGDEDLVLRADRSLKTGALDLIRLQREACAKGLVTGEDCNQIDIPDWATEPPTADADVSVLQRRSQWLGDALQNLVGAGCEAGEEATGDDRFCAVE